MSFPVKLHVYDLSQGMARQMSQAFLGKYIEGIWHTGIVVYDTEFFFGGGICSGIPGETQYGDPVEVVDLGTTSVPSQAFLEFLQGISPRYTMSTYNLLSNNCNNFSDEAAKFLTGNGIPEHIVNLPDEVMNTPLGGMLRPMLESMQQQMSSSQGLGDGSMPIPPQLQALGVGGGMGGLGASQPRPAAHAHPHDTLPLSLLRYREPVLMAQGSAGVVFKKLREFAAALPTPLSEADVAVVDALEKMLTAPTPGAVVPQGTYELLDRLVTSLPAARVFPVLDAWRLLVLHPAAGAHYASHASNPVSALLSRIASGELPPSAVVTGLRVAVNMFSLAQGVTLMVGVPTRAVACAAVSYALSDVPAARLAGATVAYNIAVRISAPTTGLVAGSHDDAMQCVVAVVHALGTHELADTETLFRLMMALGHLVLYNKDMVELANGLGLSVDRFAASTEAKVRDCAQELRAVLACSL